MRIPLSEETKGTIVGDGRKWPFLYHHYLFIPEYYPTFDKRLGTMSFADFKTIGRCAGHIHPRLRREQNENPAILEARKTLGKLLEQLHNRDESEIIKKGKSFYTVQDVKHHVVEVVQDQGIEVVIYKHWSYRRQCWMYRGDEKSIFLKYIAQRWA